ncbi:hypothetical protein JCM10213_008059 [Rhodosporidiobolus nylandii]
MDHAHALPWDRQSTGLTASHLQPSASTSRAPRYPAAPPYQPPTPAWQAHPCTPPQSADIRRARSSDTISLNSSFSPSRSAPTFPPSPVSPANHERRPVAQVAQTVVDRWGAAASRSAWLSGQAQHRSVPQQVALLETIPPTNSRYSPLLTPPRRHARHVSAQAAFATAIRPRRTYSPPQEVAQTVPGYLAPSMSFSHTTPSSNREPRQPTAEEVSQFFHDMTEILGADAMAELSPTYPADTSISAVASPPPAAVQSTSIPSISKATYNVSGVLLSEEDYQQHVASLRRRQTPPDQQFLPPLQTYQPPHRPPQVEYAPRGDHNQYSYDIQRPQSAPPTPLPEADPAFTAYASPYHRPSRSPAPFNRRRGSSLDPATVPRSVPYVLTVPPSCCTPPPRPPPAYAAINPYTQPSHASFPHNVTPPPYQPPPPVPPRLSPGGGLISPTSSFPSSPSKRPIPPDARGKKPHGVSFINFSSSDARTLLAGVAPSGSVKKRQREEEEAKAREAKRAAMARGD